ncbi:hypothetical protein Trydic_g22897 [Trypoxylus dichotomus]
MATYSEELCQIEKLVGETSYQIWKFQLIVTLKAHELYDVVNGAKLRSSLTKDEDIADWTKKDAKAQRLIVTTIDKKYMIYIIDCKNSKEMFDKIASIFERSTTDQIYSLLQQFYSFSYEKGVDMGLHVSKIENIAQLKTLKQEINENMVISKILSTLPAEYGHFLTAWESAATNEKTLEKLTSLLAEEVRNMSKECENKVAFESSEKYCRRCKSKTHNTKFCKKGNAERKCFKCGNAWHIARNSSDSHTGNQSSSGESSSIKKNMKACGICKKTNHMEKDCFYRNKNKRDQDKIALFIENRDFGAQSFVVDSGSSSHMANLRDLFSTLEGTSSSIQVAKKNERMKSEGKENIEGKACVLKDVLFVPDLRKNLLSVNTIMNDGEVIFTKEKVVIKKNKSKILEGIKSDNGLYLVDLDQIEESYVTQDQEKTKEWRRKLGHLGLNNMKKLIDMSTGMKLKKDHCNELKRVCEICLQAKQTKLPFKTSRQRASRCLEIFHRDICGPIEPTTWDDKRYILTVLDDYTYYSRIYLLRYKNEATEYLKEFIKEAEALQNIKVTKVRCDNWSEYANTNFKQWCKNKGIVLGVTIPLTPQLNGKAERLNRTLLERARALIFDAQISKEFWGEAAYVATYLLNRSPTEAGDKTPIECWIGRKPDLSRLQIFGSTAYAKTVGYTQKLDSRSEKYIFVGYSLNGYRLWDKTSRTIVVSRDVVFTELEQLVNNSRIKVRLNEYKTGDEGKDEDQYISKEDPEQEWIPAEEQIQEGQEEDIQLGEGSDQTRSGRKIKIPVKLKDYILDSEDETFLTYQEAINGPEKNQWMEAIREEKESLYKNQTWIYVDENEVSHRRFLTSKWIFKIKDDDKYKARLVIRGCQQHSGIDYNETFSPVVNANSLRTLFALATKNNMTITTFVIKTAFLYVTYQKKFIWTYPKVMILQTPATKFVD